MVTCFLLLLFLSPLLILQNVMIFVFPLNNSFRIVHDRDHHHRVRLLRLHDHHGRDFLFQKQGRMMLSKSTE